LPTPPWHDLPAWNASLRARIKKHCPASTIPGQVTGAR